MERVNPMILCVVNNVVRFDLIALTHVLGNVTLARVNHLILVQQL